MDNENSYVKSLQEKHRAQLKENRDKVIERKRRTRRLIIRGAISETLLSKTVDNVEDLNEDQFKAALEAALNKKEDDCR